jgi:hypothetical protein
MLLIGRVERRSGLVRVPQHVERMEKGKVYFDTLHKEPNMARQSRATGVWCKWLMMAE